MTDYSQSGEQIAILEYFKGKPPGKFLDIGAYDGKVFSNTLALVELGWSGVCVEPSPGAFTKLQTRHAKRGDIKLLNAAVGNAPGIIQMFESPDALSTTEKGNWAKWKDKTTFMPIYVYRATPQELFDFFGFNFDFINIDTEGTSADIFLRLPFTKLGTSLWCVEHDGKKKEIVEKAEWLGFNLLLTNGENVILGK